MSARIRVKRRKENGMLLFIDIDHFKEFNDSYGHQIGDKVLLSVAKQIASICRKEDILGRLSGDEFLLISEDVNDQHAVDKIIEKIQKINLITFSKSNHSAKGINNILVFQRAFALTRN